MSADLAWLADRSMSPTSATLDNPARLADPARLAYRSMSPTSARLAGPAWLAYRSMSPTSATLNNVPRLTDRPTALTSGPRSSFGRKAFLVLRRIARLDPNNTLEPFGHL